MNIGTAARESNLPTKTVRYYADINLVEPEARSDSGYRQYGEEEVRKLVFIRRARSFDFSVEECRELLSLFEDHSRSSADVKRITLQKIAKIKQRMSELQRLHDELAHLADACHGDDRPDCPIIDSFAGKS